MKLMGRQSGTVAMRTKIMCTAASLSLAVGGPAIAQCPWDCGDGDGNVGIVDFLALLAEWGQVGTPCDFDGGGVGITDFLDLLAAWGPCPFEGACCNPGDGACVVQSLADCNAAGGVFGGDQTDCTDSDNDRIPDAFELNTGQPEGACFSGTDPNDIDTDDDFISDGDELYGTLDGLDLPGMGVNPCHKDLLVETDWVYARTQVPDRNKMHVNQVNRLVAAFAAGDVPNPDGVPGVTLHIDYGQAPYGGGNAVPDPVNDDNVVDWALAGEFDQIKAAHFAENRNQYFHYCVLSDWLSINGELWADVPGVAEKPGDDFLISMGQFDIVGDDDRTAYLFMHELGHNLNLSHGGFENTNGKPNYFSVMNYRYSPCGVDADFDALPDDVLDYSHGLNPDLDESQLVEADGLTGVGPPIDWNGNGAIDGGTISQNINCALDTPGPDVWWGVMDCAAAISMQSNACGAGEGPCYDAVCTPLQDSDDWANITLFGIFNPDFAETQIIICGPDPKIMTLGGSED